MIYLGILEKEENMAKKKEKPSITDWISAISSIVITVCTVLTTIIAVTSQIK